VSEIRDGVFSLYIGALLVATMPPVWLAIVVLPSGRLSHRLVRLWARFIVQASGCALHVSGTERLRGLHAVMLVSNHISYIDSIVLMAVVPVDFRFVAEHGVLTWPLIGTGLRKSGHLTVDRGSRAARLACAGEMVDVLRRGRSLLVYPEGRRSRREGLLPFHLGAFRAAVDAGRPIVPIAIRGTDAIVAPDRRRVHRGSIDVTIHEPIAPEGLDRSEMVRIRQRARLEIAWSLGEPDRHRGAKPPA